MKFAFVYAGGREVRLEAARLGNVPADFFYGALEIERAGHTISVYDLNPLPSIPADLLDRCLKGRLPPKTRVADIVAAGRLLSRLRGSDAIVATSSGCAFALGFWRRLGRLSGHLVGIHCGIVNCRHAPSPRWSASWALKAMTPVLFSGNEAAEMSRQFGIERPLSLGFGVDEGYWFLDDPGRPRSGVLAVGNDGRRDYKTLLSAAALLPDVAFKVVTRLPLGEDVPRNVERIHGEWKSDSVSDASLRDLYRAAACVAVPLHESVQPAGQSVAMQAMMCGAPVVMTRTAGWWGADVLRSGEHILEVPPDHPQALAEAIRSALDSRPGRHARQALVAAGWTANGFARRIEKVAGG